MANYYHLYVNNPTVGQTDGTIVSENGLMTSPISVTLDATKNEKKVIKCAIRCEEGYESTGTITIKPYYYDGSNYTDVGGNIDKWQVAADLSTPGKVTVTVTANPSDGDTLSIGDVAITAGTDFDIGSDIKATAVNMSAAINAKSSLYKTVVSDASITLTEIYPGGGNTPSIHSITGPGSGTSASAPTLRMTQTDMQYSYAATEAQMDAVGKWGSSLTLTDTTIRQKNTIFWLKVTSSADEAPQRDSSTVIHTEVVVQAM